MIAAPPLDPRDAGLVRTASQRLSRVPARAPVEAVFDALRPCVPPLAAGIFGVIRPGAPERMVTHAVRLPGGVLDAWLATPAAVLARTLQPVLVSQGGALRRDSDALTGPLREELAVLGVLDTAGLGEGAGYKIMERDVPWHGPEHFMFALIMERRQPVSARAEAMLAALNPGIRAAVLRMGLPLLARGSILAQVVEEQALGYVCLSRSGQMLEANRRASELALRYGARAGVSGRSRVAELAQRARARARRGRPWYVAATDPPTLLQINVHDLAKEAHALREDVVLVVMNELSPPPPPVLSPVLLRLTARQREIAALLGDTPASYKEIAARLGRKEGTIRTHVEHIYRALGIRSRAELSTLLR
jgi:DNA-binding NarL/FixJ family response regulator